MNKGSPSKHFHRLFYSFIIASTQYLLFQVSAAQAEPAAAEQDRGQLFLNSSRQIKGALWDEDRETRTPLIQLCKASSEPRQAKYCVVLQGTFYNKKDSLLCDGKKIVADENGRFTTEIELKESPKVIQLTQIDIVGNQKSEEWKLLFPAWAETADPKALKRFSFAPGLAFTYITYEQPLFPKVSEMVTTVKLNALYLFNEKFSASANIFYTFLPIVSEPTGTNITFLGGNLRGGYIVPIRNFSWTLAIHAGWYFTTSYSSPTRFGYKNLYGAQISPALSKNFIRGDQAAFYLKYSPVFANFSYVDLTNAEYALGGSYFFTPYKNGTALGVTLDLAFLALRLPYQPELPGSTRVTSVSAGAAYRF